MITKLFKSQARLCNVLQTNRHTGTFLDYLKMNVNKVALYCKHLSIHCFHTKDI